MFILKIPIKYIIKPPGPVGAGPVPVGAGPVPVGAGLGQSLPVGPGADRCRPVPTGADRCRCRGGTARNAVFKKSHIVNLNTLITNMGSILYLELIFNFPDLI